MKSGDKTNLFFLKQEPLFLLLIFKKIIFLICLFV